jgi:hypothetical protein
MLTWHGIQVSDIRVPLELRLAMVSLMWRKISLLPGLVEVMVLITELESQNIISSGGDSFNL